MGHAIIPAPAPSGGGNSFVGAKAYLSGVQSISNATVTVVNLDAESFDSDGFHDNVTNNSRLTVPAGKAGKYLVVGSVGYGINSTGTRQARINMTGVAVARATANATSANAFGMNASTVVNAIAGDYFELVTYQDSGGALTATAAALDTWLACYYLGA